jgi:hypothetical protein
MPVELFIFARFHAREGDEAAVAGVARCCQRVEK